MLDEVARRARLGNQSSDAATRKLVKNLDRVRERLSHLGASAGGVLPARLDALHRKKEALEQSLARRLDTLRERNHTFGVRWKDVKPRIRNMNPGAALVAFIKYRRVTTTQDARPRVVDSYGVFTHPAGGRSRFTALGPASHVDQVVADYRNILQMAPFGDTRSGTKADAEIRRATQTLRETVWLPIAKQVEGSALLAVVPSGMLHWINFAAVSSQTGSPVEGGALIHHLSSETDLTDPAHEPQPLAAGTSSEALLVGDPQFGAVRSNGRFSPLAATASEVREIATLIGKAKVLTGGTATTAARVSPRAREVRTTPCDARFLC